MLTIRGNGDFFGYYFMYADIWVRVRVRVRVRYK
jgi:hypothetical protein